MSRRSARSSISFERLEVYLTTGMASSDSEARMAHTMTSSASVKPPWRRPAPPPPPLLFATAVVPLTLPGRRLAPGLRIVAVFALRRPPALPVLPVPPALPVPPTPGAPAPPSVVRGSRPGRRRRRGGRRRGRLRRLAVSAAATTPAATVAAAVLHFDVRR